MKKSIVLFLQIFLIGAATAQTTIWSENFNNGCTSNCEVSSYGSWSMQDNVGGTTGSAPNNWFVSCSEEGIAPPDCGSSCISDPTLHIGANPGAGGDMGASFNETGAVNATYRLAVSPIINTTGYTDLTLAFDHISFGSASCSDDRGELWLSTDGGATWPAGYRSCLNTPCCGACNGYSHGQWTLFSMTLPAAFENNTQVRIGFHWRNNGNGSGTDPATAIDDIKITTSVTLPVELLSFEAAKEGTKTRLNWSTASEINFSHFEVERSLDAKNFSQIGKVPSKGNGRTGNSNYQFYDGQLLSVAYYRLKSVDLDGTFEYSKIVSISNADGQPALALNRMVQHQNKLNCNIGSNSNFSASVEVIDNSGKRVLQQNGQSFIPGENIFSIDMSGLPAGVYLLRVQTNEKPGRAPLSLTEKFVRTR